MTYELHQTVTLAEDVPEDGLRRGWEAVILEIYDDGDYEVEVFDDNEETVFVGALPGRLLEGEHVREVPAPPRPDFTSERPRILERLSAATREMERSLARAEYIETLPVVSLSRCPLTGTIVERAIDTVELDGPWWDYRDPARPPAPLVPTLVSLSGALRLHHVPYTPFLVVPGPERPFVAPQLLGVDGVVAVVSQVKVGAHDGFPIAYFARPPGPSLEIERLNDWGSFRHLVQTPSELEERHGHPFEREWDYDLGPWITQGKLWWIAPGDPDLTLRSTLEGCPYLDLDGHRGITRLQRGEAWWPDDID